jgi:PEP-CTERM motif
MRKISLVALAAVAALAAAPAQAASFISFTPGNGTIPAYIGANLAFSQDFATGATNGTAYVASGSESVGAGSDVRLYSSDVSGEAFGPPTGTGNFLAILDGTYKVAFGTSGVSVVSFLIGGLDSYNSVVLNFKSGPSITLNGTEIIGQLFDPTPNTGQTGRVTYDFGSGPKLDSIVFGSTSRTLELDGIVAAAPEPATWLMMILGFGLIGGSLRRRRGQGKLVAA